MDMMRTMQASLSVIPSGMAFLFVYLPLSLFVYYLCPQRIRSHCLLVVSLLFYWVIQPLGVALLICSVLVDYGVIWAMGRCGAKNVQRQLLMAVSVSKSCGMLVGSGLWMQSGADGWMIGVPVFALLSIGCMLDIYQMNIHGEQSLVRFALYCGFYPRLFAGPLQGYEALNSQLAEVQLRPGEVLSGYGQLVQGVFKLVIFGGGLYALYQSAAGLDEVSVLSAWLQVVAFAFGLYYLLMGLADIAQGLGKTYGLHMPLDMYYPMQSRSMTDFFDRFHITVGDFLRENVQQRIERRYTGRPAVVLGTLLTGALFGLWFGIRLTCALWGIYIALFVLLERFAYPRLAERVPLLFCRAITLFVVLIGFPLLMAQTPEESLLLWQMMFGGEIGYNEQVLYLLSTNWLLLLASGLFATNGISIIYNRMRRRVPRLWAVVFSVINVSILVLYIILQV